MRPSCQPFSSQLHQIKSWSCYKPSDDRKDKIGCMREDWNGIEKQRQRECTWLIIMAESMLVLKPHYLVWGVYGRSITKPVDRHSPSTAKDYDEIEKYYRFFFPTAITTTSGLNETTVPQSRLDDGRSPVTDNESDSIRRMQITLQN